MRPRSIISIILLLLILVPLGFSLISLEQEVTTNQSLNQEKQFETADWLSGWEHRKLHTINGATGAGTNYQIMITVHYGSGTDSGADVYCNSHCQTDFDDIRFTDDDEVTLLDHWREDYASSVSATFWVEIADNLDTSQSIYIYFGNSETTSVSDGEATFLFFDDFGGTQLDTTNKWILDKGSIAVSGGFLHMDGADGTPNAAYLYSQDGWGSNIIQEVKAISNTPSPLAPRIVSFIDSVYGWDDMINARIDGGSNNFLTNVLNDAVWSSQASDSVSDVTSWHEYSVYWIPGEAGWAQDRGSPFSTFTSNVPDGDKDLSVIFSEAVSVGDNLDIDWVFVRKYIESEPTHSTWIAESLTSTTTGTATTITENYGSSLFMLVGGGGIVGIILLVGVFTIRSRSRKKSYSTKTGSTVTETERPSVIESRRQTSITSGSQSIAEQVKTTPALRSIITSSTTPRVIEQITDTTKPKGPIHVTSGIDVAGENLKLAVKVKNNTEYIVTDVQVILDVPSGFEFVKGKDNSQSLGNISGGEYQSAIFWLRPQRCVDGDYGGTILYKDAKGSRQTIEIPSKRIVNVCPMLTSTESADEVFSRLKSGSLARNCASFEFSGNPSLVLQMAEVRLKGLVPVDRTENEFADGTYLGYSCYVGQTKYGEHQFASEIQVSGTLSGGVLTLSIYSDDERILSGFFVDVMHDVRNHVEILKEKMCPIATCPKCGGNIDLSKVGSDRIYQCDFCGIMGKAAPWMD